MRSGMTNGIALGFGVLLLGAGGPWLADQFRSLPGPGTLQARADQRIVTLEVGGMHCEGCAISVQTQLETVPGVAEADVRLAPRRAYVVCTSGVADTALLNAVRRAGPGFMAAVATP
jgi:copper chaperone CopZ